MDLAGQDLDNVTRTILAEAGQSATPQSMAAVAAVIRNRQAATNSGHGSYGATPTAVVHAPNQFEPWNPNSGNDPTRFSPQDPGYQRAAAIAQGMWKGVVADPTNGATHFVSPGGQAAAGRNMPAWSNSTPMASIGGHQFYAPEGAVPAASISALTGGQTIPDVTGGGATPGTKIPQQSPAVPPAGAPNSTGGLQQMLAQLQHQPPANPGPQGIGRLLFGSQGLTPLLPQALQQTIPQHGLLGGLFMAGKDAMGGGQQPQQTASAAPAPQQPMMPQQQPQQTQVVPSPPMPNPAPMPPPRPTYLSQNGAQPGIGGLLASLFGGGQGATA